MAKKISKKQDDEPKVAKAPRQHVIYVEIDDEITTVYDQIKKTQGLKDIVLVIPRRAVLLQSVVNLRILKKKVSESKKSRKLIIITNDKSGQALAAQAGIKVLEKISQKVSVQDTQVAKELLDATANVASAIGRPTRLPEKKITLSTLLKKNDKSFFNKISKKVHGWRRKKQKKRQKLPEVVIVTPNKQALITFILISVLIFMVIAYIALPGATLYLTPESNRIEQSVNITLAEFEKNRTELSNHPERVIASYPITPPPIQKTSTYFATGKEFQGQNATGVITIINEAPRRRELVSSTRFQTEDGIVFRISRQVSIPPGTPEQPGTLDITVTADAFDASGQIVGGRGNIGPTRFFLPGLKNSENRKTLYGQSYETMTGGITNVVRTITQEDVDAATAKAKAEITDLALRQLTKYLEEQNLERNTHLGQLIHKKAIHIGEPTITTEDNIVGSKNDTFDITAEVVVRGIAYNPDELAKILERELNLRKSPEKRIVEIDDSSVTYKVIETNETLGKIKITATIRGIEQFEIRPEKENGSRLIKKIKDHIVGRSLNEANLFIQNLPEIDHVEIKSWPFWAPNIPSVPDNIKIIIE